jgi:hypothetical protein
LQIENTNNYKIQSLACPYQRLGLSSLHEIYLGAFWWECAICRQPNISDPASDQQDSSPQSKHQVISWLSTMRYSIDLAHEG